MDRDDVIAQLSDSGRTVLDRRPAEGADAVFFGFR